MHMRKRNKHLQAILAATIYHATRDFRHVESTQPRVCIFELRIHHTVETALESQDRGNFNCEYFTQIFQEFALHPTQHERMFGRNMCINTGKAKITTHKMQVMAT